MCEEKLCLVIDLPSHATKHTGNGPECIVRVTFILSQACISPSQPTHTHARRDMSSVFVCPEAKLSKHTRTYCIAYSLSGSLRTYSEILLSPSRALTAESDCIGRGSGFNERYNTQRGRASQSEPSHVRAFAVQQD